MPRKKIIPINSNEVPKEPFISAKNGFIIKNVASFRGENKIRHQKEALAFFKVLQKQMVPSLERTSRTKKTKRKKK